MAGVDAKTLLDQLITYIVAHITDDVSYADLLDSLVAALESSKPDIKLLTALLLAATPKQKTANATLATTVPTVTMPILKTVQTVKPQKDVSNPTPLLKKAIGESRNPNAACYCRRCSTGQV